MTPWWKKAVIYQIYPKSFQDSNGDGIGDIPGIISRLEYLEKLGIDAIWLSPVYLSPGIDNGYDISDYQKIAPQYGTMKDMDNLIKEAKKHHIRIVMDLVVNHTSDQHPWFVEAKKSQDNPYRDFYIWRDPVDGHEPNDLKSAFSGSAWKFDEKTGQYYLHFFADQQPDLNWKNPELRNKVYDMMNYWIDKGISGFRMDVIELIGKDPDQKIRENGPMLHPYLKEMNEHTFANKDMMTVGETWNATPKIAEEYSDPARHELSMVFQFENQALDQEPGKEKWDVRPLDLGELKKVLIKWQTEIDFNHAWNSLFWENHDIPRVISRWGNDQEYRVQCAKMFAIILHLMRGTPYIYNGEEIGMTNCPVKSIDEVEDIESINMYHERLEQGYKRADLINSINVKGRDNARRPMQWSNEENAGFTSGNPWLKVNPNYQKINVKAALADLDSIFYTYQKLIKLRHENPVVVDGDFELVENTGDSVLAFWRKLGSEKWLIVANLSGDRQRFNLDNDFKEVLISNYEKQDSLKNIILKPYEAFAVKA
ncbi:alpha-glucosidase [Lactobacillus gasseri]|jgi:alpha,alpha-phosphotrehalase|uniref:glycoside hydrolase family 13 protein n=1 Tax=Lactobacillus gasseri TaxID=1596 RepID=UPI001C4E0C45|nr:alpha-glucosidase [Lactobacillus gasseri]MBW0438447.1 alpha-glucosidase [Lactobacillus gasseri]MBW0439747.1 alpha-glucosidase [Lactobacillus gasseri]MBW0451486.1 alpha-glucosidase [Lactobacillus gasseri]MBW0452910.1 alpha-glucosidase [Lactobacillus gasseri]MBW0459039.1 alpha-glucosidase [Lactobacillus gasseri]